MAVNLSPVGGAGAQFFDNNGDPLTGGKLYTYLAGTTTPAVTYTTYQGNVARTNPIVLDAAGRVSSGGEIWLTQNITYKFVLKDSNDVTIASYDNISGISALTLPIDSSDITYDPPFTSGVATTVEVKLSEWVSPEDFGATGGADDSAAWQAAIDTGQMVIGLSGRIYTVSGLVGVTNGQVIDGRGCTLKLKTGGSFIYKQTGGTYVPDSPINNTVFKNFKFDMNNVANAKGFWHNGGWNLTVENISSNEVVANTPSTSYEIYIDVASAPRGSYVSDYRNIAIKQAKLLGIDVGTNAVTTINFYNLQCSFGGVYCEESLSINFYSPVIQQTTSAFTFKNSAKISIFAAYVEGCTTYLDATASGVSNVLSCGGNLSVTNYVTGTITGYFKTMDFSSPERGYFIDTAQTKISSADIFDAYLLPGTAADSGRQFWYQQVGIRNTELIAEERVQASATGPLVGRYELRVNTGNSIQPSMVVQNGQVAFGDNIGNPTADIDTNGDTLRVQTSSTKASSAATGSGGMICWDANYLYVHNGTGWRRIALGSAF